MAGLLHAWHAVSRDRKFTFGHACRAQLAGTFSRDPSTAHHETLDRHTHHTVASVQHRLASPESKELARKGTRKFCSARASRAAAAHINAICSEWPVRARTPADDIGADS